MARSYTVFSDESGHTGPDLLNQAEPLVVLSGVSIEASRLSTMASSVEELSHRQQALDG